MSSTMIVKLMTNLINKKFYKTADDAIAKLDVYFAMNRISEEEYAELAMLAQEKYAPEVEEPDEPNTEPDPEEPVTEPEEPETDPETPVE